MRLLIEADNAVVGIVDGRLTRPTGRFDCVLRVPGTELRPGLINAHDHLHRNHYGRLGAPPYANAYEWGRDIHTSHSDEIAAARALPRRQALLIGAWKNLLAGVTTVVHHDRWEDAFEHAFPIRVARVRVAHSLGFEQDMNAWRLASGPFTVHLAEGVDSISAEEVRELERRGLLGSNLLAVHVVAADSDGIHKLRASGSAVVWCPTSNLFLFGVTAPAELVADGVDVLLGSDSLVTGAGTLLDELRCARSLGMLSDDRLLDAVGSVAARRLGVDPPSLEEGAPADLALFRRPVLEATVADVALVVVDGIPRVVDPALRPQLEATVRALCAHGELRLRRLTMHGVARLVLDDPADTPVQLPLSRPSATGVRQDRRPDSTRWARP